MIHIEITGCTPADREVLSKYVDHALKLGLNGEIEMTVASREQFDGVAECVEALRFCRREPKVPLMRKAW